MKKLLIGIFAAMIASAASAADEVKLQLQWVTQAQFAGYYVALDKGYYKDEGLDVTILPGGPDVAPPQVLAGGGADVMDAPTKTTTTTKRCRQGRQTRKTSS